MSRESVESSGLESSLEEGGDRKSWTRDGVKGASCLRALFFKTRKGQIYNSGLHRGAIQIKTGTYSKEGLVTD